MPSVREKTLDLFDSIFRFRLRRIAQFCVIRPHFRPASGFQANLRRTFACGLPSHCSARWGRFHQGDQADREFAGRQNAFPVAPEAGYPTSVVGQAGFHMVAMHRPVAGLRQGRRRERNITVETQKIWFRVRCPSGEAGDMVPVLASGAARGFRRGGPGSCGRSDIFATRRSKN